MSTHNIDFYGELANIIKFTPYLFFCFYTLFCLFVLRLNVPVNNYLVMLGQSHPFLGITSTFRGGRFQTPDWIGLLAMSCQQKQSDANI